MRSRQQGTPGGQYHQMVDGLVFLIGTTHRRRSSDDNCQISLLDEFVDLLEVVRYLPKPYDAWQYFSYRQRAR